MNNQFLPTESNDHHQFTPPQHDPAVVVTPAPSINNSSSQDLTPEKLLSIQKSHGNQFAIQLIKQHEQQKAASKQTMPSLAATQNAIQSKQVTPQSSDTRPASLVTHRLQNATTIQRTLTEVITEIALKIGVPATLGAIAAYFGAPAYIVQAALTFAAPGAIHMVITRLQNWRTGAPIPLAVAAPAVGNPIPIAVNLQRKSNWCWAAAAEAIINYYGDSVTQEQLADQHTKARSAGDEQADPFGPISAAGHENGTKHGMISWNDLTASIDAGQPSLARVGASRDAHYIIIVGYTGRSGRDPNRKYIIIDPRVGTAPQALTYDELKNYQGSYLGTVYTK